jgi:GAF domain-containing protein
MKRLTKVTREPIGALPSLDAAARAMLTAAELFATTQTPRALLDRAADLLAEEPGQMCLISRVSRPGDTLHPVTIAHERSGLVHKLREGMRWGVRPPADAFSREVQRTGRSLRMPIVNPQQLGLWLPNEYTVLAEGAGVCAVLAAALTNRSRVVGTLLLWRERGQPAFADADEAYVSALARRLGLGLPRLA